MRTNGSTPWVLLARSSSTRASSSSTPASWSASITQEIGASQSPSGTSWSRCLVLGQQALTDRAHVPAAICGWPAEAHASSIALVKALNSGLFTKRGLGRPTTRCLLFFLGGTPGISMLYVTPRRTHIKERARSHPRALLPPPPTPYVSCYPRVGIHGPGASSRLLLGRRGSPVR